MQGLPGLLGSIGSNWLQETQESISILSKKFFGYDLKLDLVRKGSYDIIAFSLDVPQDQDPLEELEAYIQNLSNFRWQRVRERRDKELLHVYLSGKIGDRPNATSVLSIPYSREWSLSKELHLRSGIGFLFTEDNRRFYGEWPHPKIDPLTLNPAKFSDIYGKLLSWKHELSSFLLGFSSEIYEYFTSLDVVDSLRTLDLKVLEDEIYDDGKRLLHHHYLSALLPLTPDHDGDDGNLLTGIKAVAYLSFSLIHFDT